MQYSLLDRRPEESCLPLLKENGIGVLARGVIAKGLLKNKSITPFLDYSPAQIKKMKEAVAAIANSSRNPIQATIRFVLKKKEITSAIIGIRSPNQLDEAVSTVNTEELSAQEIQYLEHILPINTYHEHR